MGYWVVMAIVAIAIVAVLIAVGSEEEPSSPRASTTGDRPIWVAMGSNGSRTDQDAQTTSPHWVDLVRDALGERVVTYDFTRAGCTAGEAQHDQLAAAVAIAPDVVSLLLGPDDFRDAEDLGAFERRLRHILTTMRGVGSVPVLAVLPDLTTLPSLASEEDPASLVEELRSWNVAFERLAASANGEIVGCTMVDDTATGDLFTEDGGRYILTAAGQQWFASLMERPVKRLLGIDEPVLSTPASTDTEAKEME